MTQMTTLSDDKRREPQQDRSVQRRQRILDSTAALLNTINYAALNVGDIARHAGTSVGSIYQYFPNKDAVLQALAEQYLEDMQQLAGVVLSPQGESMRARVEGAIDWLVVYGQTHPGFHHIVKSEWVSVALRNAVEGVFGNIHVSVCSIIGEAIPQLTAQRQMVCAYVAMGMIWGVLEKFSHTPPEFHADMVIELKRAVVGYLESVVSER